MITIILTLLALGFAIFLSTNHQANPTPTSEETPINDQRQEPNEPIELPEGEISEPPASELKDEFAEAIQRTINYFSGKKTNVVAIGDSLTQGVGDSSEQGGYVGILDRQLNQNSEVVTFENYGKRGNRTDHLIKRLKQTEIHDSIQQADIVLITIGANDIMQVVKENFMNITYEIFASERNNYETRLRDIFAELAAINPDASIYLIGFYNPFENYFEHIKELDMIVDEWNETGRQVAEDYRATFVPTKDLFISNSTNLFAEDHFHPNDEGYQRIAERILNYLVVDE